MGFSSKEAGVGLVSVIPGLARKVKDKWSQRSVMVKERSAGMYVRSKTMLLARWERGGGPIGHAVC